MGLPHVFSATAPLYIILLSQTILMVALWLQKVVKNKRTDGINVKPQQHIATKENQSIKILMPF